MIAVIAGATGLVGSHLLQKLIDDHQITQIISVSRKPLSVSSEKLKEVIVKDFSHLSEVSEKLKGNVYFCCLGTTIKVARTKDNFRKVDHDAVLELGKIAKHHHADSFILVSAQGANPKSFVFYNKVKGEVESDLKALGLQRLVIMHPSLLIGDRQEFRFGEKVFIKIAEGIGPILPGKVRKMAMTRVVDLSDRMLKESKQRKSGLSVIEAKYI